MQRPTNLANLLPALLGALLLGAGCATPERYNQSRLSYGQGDYLATVHVITNDIPDHYEEPEKSKDKYVLDDLIVGAAFQAAEEYGEARDSFDSAEKGISFQEDRGMVGNFGHLVLQLLANDNAAPYRVQQYDRIMANTYKALGHLAEGEVDLARVEFNRASERQRVCSEVFAKQIAAEKKQQEMLLSEDAANRLDEEEKAEGADHADKEVADGDEATDADGKPEKKSAAAKMIDEFKDAAIKTAMTPVRLAMDDPQMEESLDAYRKNIGDWGTYAGYTVPYTSYLNGLFRTVYGEDQDDYEVAAKLLGEVAVVSPSPTAKRTFKVADLLANGGRLPNGESVPLQDFVWVVYENGMGPTKTEFKFAIPIPAPGLPIATIALPTLNKGTDAYSSLSVTDGEQELESTELLCDMNAVVANEFRTQYTGIITRNAISSILKTTVTALVAYKVQEKYGDLAAFAAAQLMNVLWGLTAHADLRLWNELPNNVQATFFLRPESGKVVLKSPDGSEPLAEVTLAPDAANIILVRIPSSFAAPVCRLLTSPSEKASSGAVKILKKSAAGYVLPIDTPIEYKQETPATDYSKQVSEMENADSAAKDGASAGKESVEGEPQEEKGLKLPFGFGKKKASAEETK